MSNDEFESEYTGEFIDFEGEPQVIDLKKIEKTMISTPTEKDGHFNKIWIEASSADGKTYPTRDIDPVDLILGKKNNNDDIKKGQIVIRLRKRWHPMTQDVWYKFGWGGAMGVAAEDSPKGRTATVRVLVNAKNPFNVPRP